MITELTPREIVAELDRWIVGQKDAKRAVAVAVRNRWRRRRLPEDLRDEVPPRNIIMMGPTGVGKTEIARRLSRLFGAPFLKIEASKYTEVGYHGRDVESIVRDLVEVSIQLVREEKTREVEEPAREAAEERLLDILLPGTENLPETPRPDVGGFGGAGAVDDIRPADEDAERRRRSREKMRQALRDGKLEGREVEIEVEETQKGLMQIFGNQGIEELGIDLPGMLGGAGKKRKTRRVGVEEALDILTKQESEKLLDEDAVTRDALERAQTQGIVFVDEIDKVAGSGRDQGPDVSREGVQRDLLPIVEGTTVMTRHGPVTTDHILFIAAGAFHVSSPADLLPELQGRFPIRVELTSLGRDDFVRILSEPENSLVRQATALLGTEGVTLEFTDEAVDALADTAVRVNTSTQDIGARRLQTVMETLLEEVSFDADQLEGTTVRVDADMVAERLAKTAEDEDLSRYIL